MKYIKSALIRGFIGIPIGVFISFTFIILFNYFLPHTSTISYKYISIQYFLGSTIGFLYSSLSIVFEINSWSFTKQTSIHFFITTIILLVCLIASNSFPMNLINIILYLIIYFIIWLCFKTYFSKNNK